MTSKVALIAFLLSAVVSTFAQAPVKTHASTPETIMQSFHDALQTRDLKRIESLVAADLVVFENGERNDGWTDFRDNHLVPEMKDPAPQTKWQLVKVRAVRGQAWGYTRETFTSRRGREVVLWSIYVLEKRAGEWKIVMLDWSIK